MDNPISWGILLFLVILYILQFPKECEKSISRNRKANEEFFLERENKKFVTKIDRK